MTSQLMDTPDRYNPSIDDILRLNWHQQKVGKRFQLQRRLQVVTEYVNYAGELVDRNYKRIETMPVTWDTANERAEFLMIMGKYESAVKARQILERELQRRGETF